MNDNLLRFRKGVKYAVSDVETFNLALTFKVNRIWQMGVLMAEDEKIQSEHDIRIELRWEDSPHLHIGAGAAAITHFNQREHDKLAINQKDAFKKTWDLLKSVDFIIFHNGLCFDLYLLRDWAILNGADWKWLVPKIIDTKAILFGLKTYNPFNPDKQSFFEYQYQNAVAYKKSIKTNLKLACQEREIEFDESRAHEALYDVNRTFQLWNRLKWEINI